MGSTAPGARRSWSATAEQARQLAAILDSGPIPGS